MGCHCKSRFVGVHCEGIEPEGIEKRTDGHNSAAVGSALLPCNIAVLVFVWELVNDFLFLIFYCLKSSLLDPIRQASVRKCVIGTWDGNAGWGTPIKRQNREQIVNAR